MTANTNSRRCPLLRAVLGAVVAFVSRPLFMKGLAFGGVRVRCLCVRCVLCLVCLPLHVRPRVCPVPVLRFGEVDEFA